MPNWCTQIVKLTAKNDVAKKQIHTFIDKHIVKNKTADWRGSFFDIDNNSLIPIPEGIEKLKQMGQILQGDDGSIKTNPNYSKEAEEAQRKKNLKEYGYDDWYHFCLDNWGSKWGFCSPEFVNEYNEPLESISDIHDSLDKNGYLEFKAYSAWSSPLGLMQKICELYPDIEFRGEWGEEQVTEYYGVITYDKENGGKQVTKDDMDVDEAYNMLDRLGLLSADQDDGYFVNREKGIIDYDERLDENSDNYIPEYREKLIGCEH